MEQPHSPPGAASAPRSPPGAASAPLARAASEARGIFQTPLEECLTQLLSHLSSADKLALFSVSRSFSAAVLSQTTSTALTLPGCRHHAAGHEGTATCPGHPPHSLPQTLAAGARAVSLTMCGALFTPLPCLRPKVTALTFKGLACGSGDRPRIAALLRDLSNVTSVAFDQCEFIEDPDQASDSAPTAQDWPEARAMDSVTVRGCTGAPYTTMAFVSGLVPAAGQVRELVTDDPRLARELHQVRGLKEVRVLAARHAWGKEPDRNLGLQASKPSPPPLKDTDLRSLLSHPTLSHVTLGCDIMLEERHVDSACNWETLRVQGMDATGAGTLAALPLAQLRDTLIVHGTLHDSYFAQHMGAALANLARCRAVRFEPMSTTAWTWHGLQQWFGLDLIHCNEAHSEQLVALVLKNLTGGVVLIQDAPLTPTLLHTLRHTNPNLDTVYFFVSGQRVWERWAGPVLAAIERAAAGNPAPTNAIFIPPLPPVPPPPPPPPGVLTYLPDHVTHVMLGFRLWTCSPDETWLLTLRRLLNGVAPSRRFKLTLVDMYTWRNNTKVAVRDWLTQHMGNSVQVDFKQ